jgi:hypothetical protein
MTRDEVSAIVGALYTVRDAAAAALAVANCKSDVAREHLVRRADHDLAEAEAAIENLTALGRE